MSVLVSAVTFVPGGMGGSETYAREVLAALAPETDVRVLVRENGRGAFPGAREVVVPGPDFGSSSRARLRVLGGALLGRQQAATRSAAVVHYPFTVPVPRPTSGQRSVVTLHDVQHRDLPQLFSIAERMYRRFAYDRAAVRADAVITVSEFCKERIVHHLGLDPDAVHVAPLGVRREDFPVSTDEREPFLLYPARGWPHKNHRRLFTAFSLARESRPDLRLVLTGARAQELGDVPPYVDVRGHVSRAELAHLYGTAAAMVFPSTYEGFGLPVLEAMSSGCPVAVARAGALPDTAGGSAVLFDPSDPADIARAALEAVDRAPSLSAAGLERVAQFSWARCARVHEQVYRRLQGSPRH